MLRALDMLLALDALQTAFIIGACIHGEAVVDDVAWCVSGHASGVEEVKSAIREVMDLWPEGTLEHCAFVAGVLRVGDVPFPEGRQAHDTLHHARTSILSDRPRVVKLLEDVCVEAARIAAFINDPSQWEEEAHQRCRRRHRRLLKRKGDDVDEFLDDSALLTCVQRSFLVGALRVPYSQPHRMPVFRQWFHDHQVSLEKIRQVDAQLHESEPPAPATDDLPARIVRWKLIAERAFILALVAPDNNPAETTSSYINDRNPNRTRYDRMLKDLQDVDSSPANIERAFHIGLMVQNRNEDEPLNYFAQSFQSDYAVLRHADSVGWARIWVSRMAQEAVTTIVDKKIAEKKARDKMRLRLANQLEGQEKLRPMDKVRSHGVDRNGNPRQPSEYFKKRADLPMLVWRGRDARGKLVQ